MGQMKDSGQLNMSWDELATVINKEFRGDDDSEYRTEAAYRKPYQQAKRYYESGVFNKLNEEAYFKELQLQKQQLQKETVKVRDERNELRRVIREEARKESYKDQILRAISEFNCNPLDYDKSKQFTGILKTDNDLIISLTDVHAGIYIDNFFNKFNENVLKDRLNHYLDKIFEVQLRQDRKSTRLNSSHLR